ncbi:NAD(P)H:quinone oxidoreductase type IV [Rhizocola hellebori]|uniref:NAD(P)H:quinone oxidoreductase type IV n=1 Tax=Rhizocola hellebori TaxID=1392758 RepID=A0A8J3QCN8_9ACTN|nr:NAD(P)H:quinone oxidoreductase [Rhizocola hellebori]GIH07607.1 NAD(P)H:quinone oxidoreductase type IV [Rhizocola hellebori]
MENNDVNIAVIYYSSTGTIYRIAQEIAESAEKAGAQVRLRKAAELAPRAAIDTKPAWAAHLAETHDVPVVSADDVTWADGIAFGTPSRFGNVAAQLKQFIDTLGPLWVQGRLADKAYTAFTSGTTIHGGMETTLVAIYNMIYHFGGIVVPPGYSDPVKLVDGNPYGTSHVLGTAAPIPVGEVTLQAARAQANRLVRLARAVSVHDL